MVNHKLVNDNSQVCHWSFTSLALVIHEIVTVIHEHGNNYSWAFLRLIHELLTIIHELFFRLIHELITAIHDQITLLVWCKCVLHYNYISLMQMCLFFFSDMEDVQLTIICGGHGKKLYTRVYAKMALVQKKLS